MRAKCLTVRRRSRPMRRASPPRASCRTSSSSRRWMQMANGHSNGKEKRGRARSLEAFLKRTIPQRCFSCGRSRSSAGHRSPFARGMADLSLSSRPTPRPSRTGGFGLCPCLPPCARGLTHCPVANTNHRDGCFYAFSTGQLALSIRLSKSRLSSLVDLSP